MYNCTCSCEYGYIHNHVFCSDDWLCMYYSGHGHMITSDWAVLRADKEISAENLPCEIFGYAVVYYFIIIVLSTVETNLTEGTKDVTVDQYKTISKFLLRSVGVPFFKGWVCIKITSVRLSKGFCVSFWGYPHPLTCNFFSWFIDKICGAVSITVNSRISAALLTCTYRVGHPNNYGMHTPLQYTKGFLSQTQFSQNLECLIFTVRSYKLLYTLFTVVFNV